MRSFAQHVSSLRLVRLLARITDKVVGSVSLIRGLHLAEGLRLVEREHFMFIFPCVIVGEK